MRKEFLGLTSEQFEGKAIVEINSIYKDLNDQTIDHETAYEQTMEIEKELSDMIIDHKTGLYGTRYYEEWDELMWIIRAWCSKQMSNIVKDFERKNK